MKQLAILLLTFFLSHVGVCGAATPTVTLNLKVEKKNDQYILNLVLKNTGRMSIEVGNSDLPWGSSYGMLLIPAVLDSQHELLEDISYIDDPSTVTTQIKPGRSVSGQIVLNDRFPQFLETIKNRKLVVFWSYQLETVDDQKAERLYGHFVPVE